MWISVGHIHKKDLRLLKLDQQTTAVQLMPITSSVEAAQVDEPFVRLYRTAEHCVESPADDSLCVFVLIQLRSAVSFLILQPLTNSSFPHK
ncbi:hypothetical protein I79_017495 [Cricetulus griseus]|uniref:Uncharacterized protein n=1 Tax=Cricetulus griseus TaxID=10029 RepID=G3I269_CRIGR|nr:hypothetical protein I79_017495 [Cricetulus griseus]